MFGFSKKKPPEPEAAPPEENEVQLICEKIATFILPQISAAGLSVGQVPPTGYSGIGPATGYLYGLCFWLATLHEIPADDERLTALHVWAFDEIYGRMIGFPLLKETMARFRSGDPLVRHGVERARLDMLNVFDNNEMPQGFAHYATGAAFDEDA